MNARFQVLLPALVLAAGILAATSISFFTTESRWLALVGPLALAGTVVAARAIGRGARKAQPEWLSTTVISAVSLFVAGAIVAVADPAGVPLILPVLGGASVIALDRPSRCAATRVRAPRAA
jgi:hypothetical protein